MRRHTRGPAFRILDHINTKLRTVGQNNVTRSPLGLRASDSTPDVECIGAKASCGSPNNPREYLSMLRSLHQCIFLILFFGASLFGQGTAGGQESSLPSPGPASPSQVAPPKSIPPKVSPVTGSVHSVLGDAIQHYRRGEYDAAIQSYSEILEETPKSPDAYVGLAHVYLKQKKVEQAYGIATKGVNATDAPTVHVALGEVYFHQGKIDEAAQEWANVINIGYPSARAYWGMSRLRTATSFYKQAKEMLDKAHELDPTDPDIQKYWINSLSREEQIQFWENYLAESGRDHLRPLPPQ